MATMYIYSAMLADDVSQLNTWRNTYLHIYTGQGLSTVINDKHILKIHDVSRNEW
jgi:hypothetical protein